MTELLRWQDLRRFTPARVALGRAGNGLPTAAHLDFVQAHAAARDAVHTRLDVPALRRALAGDSLVVHSACPDRATYLARPDLGRRLAVEDRAALAAGPGGRGVLLVICDGLSALAVQRHAPPLAAALAPLIDYPIVIAEQGRVALGDDIGEALGASAVLVLIGERPGLSAPDSLGAYLTWQPRLGRMDAERNCVSNIRADGLRVDLAASTLGWLIASMLRLRLTGVELKDQSGALPHTPPGAKPLDLID